MSVSSNARKFIEADALNYESHGCEIVNISGDENSAEFTCKDYYNSDDLEFLKFSASDFDKTFNELGKALAQGLNLKYSWNRDGYKKTVKVRK